ncbi:MAG: DNA repair protein RadA, partial [Candidatus Bipolaricaulia bacterium]
RCGAWDSYAETREAGVERRDASWLGEDLRPIAEISLADVARIPTGMTEFDRLLGGGLVPGGVILFGGEPGIGKSTLLLQVAHALAERVGNVLYVSGEESESQVKLRASRIGVDSRRLFVLSEQSLDRIAAAVEKVAPCALFVDSIQTATSSAVDGEAGSIRQLREVAGELIRITKSRRLATFLVGHITKDGAFAGPKSVEHLVDVALYLEGGRGEDVRFLRSVKNRFGSTDEAAVLRMTSSGMQEIANPSAFFLEGHAGVERPGAVVVPILEGTRPILVELQALVSPTGGFGVPQRRCTGLDINRVLLLLAVIEKELAVHVGGADVYLSVAGGLEARERGSDLGAVAAIVSSLRDRPLPPRTCVVGEVGLSGEVRAVRRIAERAREAEKMGYERILVPAAGKPREEQSIDVVPVASIDRAVAELGLG